MAKLCSEVERSLSSYGCQIHRKRKGEREGKEREREVEIDRHTE